MNEITKNQLSPTKVLTQELPMAKTPSPSPFFMQGLVDRPYTFFEFLPHHPYEVLNKVFSNRVRCDELKELLCLWTRDLDATGNDGSYGVEAREALKEFYSDLYLLIDALYIIYEQHNKCNHHDTKSRLSKFTDTVDEPSGFVRDFCIRYPKVYVRRELWCCLHGAIELAHHNPEDCLPGKALDWFERVFSLTEAAYLLPAEH